MRSKKFDYDDDDDDNINNNNNNMLKLGTTGTISESQTIPEHHARKARN
jgi:hypothetical protein